MYKAAICFVLMLAAISTARSQQTAALAAAISPAKAKADFQRFSRTLASSRAITYDSKITYASADGIQHTAMASVKLERPGKLVVQLTGSDGTIESLVDDGTTLTAFTPGPNLVTSGPAGSNLAAIIHRVVAASRTLYPTDHSLAIDLDALLYFPTGFFTGQFDLGSSRQVRGLNFAEETATLNGEMVRVLKESDITDKSALTLIFTVDFATLQPVSFSFQFERPVGKTISTMTEDYSRVMVSKRDLPNSSFSYTPPSTATTIEAPIDPNNPVVIPIGTAVADFSLTSESGTTVKLSDFAGKVVVVDFWATWCGPCQLSLPHTLTIAQRMAGQNVVFLPICVWDQRVNFDQWVQAHKKYSQSVYFDPAAGNAAASIPLKLFGVSGVPMQFVIGTNGKVTASFLGYDPQVDPSEHALVLAIKSALARQ